MPTHTTLYHRPATSVIGDAIVPLSTMRTKYPDLYALHSRKYSDAPWVPDESVDPLGCRWSDVVFLSPVHPGPLFAALRRSGRRVADEEPWRLDATRLDPERTVIRLMRHGRSGHRADPPTADDYLPYTTASLRAVNRITIDAIDRLENLLPEDPWFPWVDVPHVLYHGEIPVAWFRR
ncbi:MAG: hypothetical protein ACTH2Q_04920 [Propionibacteriaceae bacterium]